MPNYLSTKRPTPTEIYDNVSSQITIANQRRKAEGKAPLKAPDQKTIKRIIDQIDPWYAILLDVEEVKQRTRLPPIDGMTLNSSADAFSIPPDAA